MVVISFAFFAFFACFAFPDGFWHPLSLWFETPARALLLFSIFCRNSGFQGVPERSLLCIRLRNFDVPRNHFHDRATL